MVMIHYGVTLICNGWNNEVCNGGVTFLLKGEDCHKHSILAYYF